jgi:hypothetical protein
LSPARQRLTRAGDALNGQAPDLLL